MRDALRRIELEYPASMNGEVMDALHRSKGLVQGLSEVAGIKTAHATLPAIDFDAFELRFVAVSKGLGRIVRNEAA